MMPKLDGFDMLKAIRADERTAAVPVILLSARAGESLASKESRRADDYIVKPFTARQLETRVELNLGPLPPYDAKRGGTSGERRTFSRAGDGQFGYGVSHEPGLERDARATWAHLIADTEAPSRTWLQKYVHPDNQQRVMSVAMKPSAPGAYSNWNIASCASMAVSAALSRAIPLQNAKGEITEWLGTATMLPSVRGPRKLFFAARNWLL